jgi:hypothetical protein
MSIVHRHITPPTTRDEAIVRDFERRAYWPEFEPIESLTREEVIAGVQIVAQKHLLEDLTFSRLAGVRPLDLSAETELPLAGTKRIASEVLRGSPRPTKRPCFEAEIARRYEAFQERYPWLISASK